MNVEKNGMGPFFDWLAKPMNQEDIDAWYLANNITPEFTELFRDFCLSFLNLLNDTYLGGFNYINSDTKVLMSENQKKEHFKWCWNKTIENFKKEEIQFIFEQNDYIFFESFFYDVFYNQEEEKIQNSLNVFFNHLFDDSLKKTKADIEVFTDIYKTLERSLNKI
jgi:hypothetical protein